MRFTYERKRTDIATHTRARANYKTRTTIDNNIELSFIIIYTKKKTHTKYLSI